jgi:hypothetical protein
MIEMRGRARGTGLATIGVMLCMLAAACNGSDITLGGEGSSPIADELREAGFDDYLGVQAPYRSAESNGWTSLFYDAAEEGAVCLNGGEFQISFRDGPSDQVLIYLQGGGACWDHLTCHVLGTATTTANGPIEGGVLDLDDPRSPFRDYDIVYVPYCDGSVFTGDATVFYDGIKTYHHGLRNLSVAVDAIRDEFPRPSRIVIAGSSAGGYGTFAGYGAVRAAFPRTDLLVFNDSGPGVQNLEASADVQARVANWNFTDRIPASCTDCDEQYTFLIDWSLDRDPNLRTALYSYQEDGVISFFIDLDGPAYRELVLEVTDEVHRRQPTRFQRYFPQGTAHTVLLSDVYYTQAIDGVALRDWTQAFLDGTDAWQDVIE